MRYHLDKDQNEYLKQITTTIENPTKKEKATPKETARPKKRTALSRLEERPARKATTAPPKKTQKKLPFHFLPIHVLTIILVGMALIRIFGRLTHKTATLSQTFGSLFYLGILCFIWYLIYDAVCEEIEV